VILAAGVLVLLGLGLFVAGILTGTTALYWACVAACVVAAVLLVAARRRLTAGTSGAGPASSAVAEGSPVGAPSGDGSSGNAPSGDGGAAAAPSEQSPGDGAHAIGASEPVAIVPEDPAVPEDLGDPPVEEVEVTDLLLVVDLTDEVLVVDEHPRYHLAGCAHLAGRTAIPLPLDEARTDGFTPCGVCEPDRHLAEQVRARKAAGNS
jgi:hypothetical protein